jgi:hypothetical protein
VLSCIDPARPRSGDVDRYFEFPEEQYQEFLDPPTRYREDAYVSLADMVQLTKPEWRRNRRTTAGCGFYPARRGNFGRSGNERGGGFLFQSGALA